MKAVQRISSAWRRFFFIPGRIIRTVISTVAVSGWRSAGERMHPAARPL